MSQNVANDPAEVQSELGRTVKALRHQLGITQEELAWRANLHRTYIADIERGGRNLTLRNLCNMAKALEVTLPGLLGGAGGGSSKSELGEVLLIEDEPSSIELTLRAFIRARLRNPVRIARDGAEALDILFGAGPTTAEAKPTVAVPPYPVLILLDLKLPKVSGLEVLQRLKSSEATRDIPVVILTSSPQDRSIQECARLGAVNYIIKPVDFEGLTRVTPALSLGWSLIQSPSL